LIRVATRFYAFLRERVGRQDDTLELGDDATVGDFLEKLAEKYEHALVGYVFDADKHLRSGFAVALNGENVKPEEFSSRRLRDGDVVVILPPIAGGYLNKGSLTPVWPWYFPE